VPLVSDEVALLASVLDSRAVARLSYSSRRAAATRAVAAANTSDLARYTRARDIEAAQRELTAEP
jgi:hypothetical protein